MLKTTLNGWLLESKKTPKKLKIFLNKDVNKTVLSLKVLRTTRLPLSSLVSLDNKFRIRKTSMNQEEPHLVNSFKRSWTSSLSTDLETTNNSPSSNKTSLMPLLTMLPLINQSLTDLPKKLVLVTLITTKEISIWKTSKMVLEKDGSKFKEKF